MSQSTNLPKWVNTQDQGQVQRAIFVAGLKQVLTDKAGMFRTGRYNLYKDTSLQPVERLCWGVFLLSDVMDQIVEGAKGLSEVLMIELASNLQQWVITGNDDLIQIALEMCEVGFKELDRVLDEQTEKQQ